MSKRVYVTSVCGSQNCNHWSVWKKIQETQALVEGFASVDV